LRENARAKAGSGERSLKNLLVISENVVSSALISQLKGIYDSIFVRDSQLSLDAYYEAILEWVVREKADSADVGAVLAEEGSGVRPAENEAELYLATDINGLMVQPACRTEDEQGGVRFTDVSELFDARWRETAKKQLEDFGVQVEAASVAAVAAPALLSPTERSALVSMGADVVAGALYLDARAARACGMAALGVVFAGGHPKSGDPERRAEILSRLAAGS